MMRNLKHKLTVLGITILIAVMIMATLVAGRVIATNTSATFYLNTERTLAKKPGESNVTTIKEVSIVVELYHDGFGYYSSPNCVYKWTRHGHPLFVNVDTRLYVCSQLRSAPVETLSIIFVHVPYWQVTVPYVRKTPWFHTSPDPGPLWDEVRDATFYDGPTELWNAYIMRGYR